MREQKRVGQRARRQRVPAHYAKRKRAVCFAPLLRFSGERNNAAKKRDCGANEQIERLQEKSAGAVRKARTSHAAGYCGGLLACATAVCGLRRGI